MSEKLSAAKKKRKKKCEISNKAGAAPPCFTAGLGSRPDGPPSGSFHHLCNNKERGGRRVAHCCNLSGRIRHFPGQRRVKALPSKRSNPDTGGNPPPLSTAELGMGLVRQSQSRVGMRSEVTAVKRGESHACDISLQRESPLSHSISPYLSASPHSHPQRRRQQCSGKTIKAPL